MLKRSVDLSDGSRYRFVVTTLTNSWRSGLTGLMGGRHRVSWIRWCRRCIAATGAGNRSDARSRDGQLADRLPAQMENGLDGAAVFDRCPRSGSKTRRPLPGGTPRLEQFLRRAKRATAWGSSC